MFSSYERLQRRTPAQGINRREFIAHLVEEYHTTTNVEAQEQVTANLANFAYDPLNWPFLNEAEALHVFVEVLVLPNERLQLHGLAGLCNICLDAQAFHFITNPTNCTKVNNLLLRTENADILLNCITLYYQLLCSADNCPALRQQLATPTILKRIQHLREHCSDQRVSNTAALFLEDYGSRTEIVQLHDNQNAGAQTKALL